MRRAAAREPAVVASGGTSSLLLIAALIAALVATLAAVPRAQAQVIRGLVQQADSVTPARGVMLNVNEVRGADIARTVSNERGEFLLSLPRAGRFEVRALRVGYRPTLVPPVDVAADTVTVRIVLARDLVQLSTITVRRSDDCRARDQGGARVADVWEEARKALLAAQTPRSGGTLVAEWVQYDRQLDSTGSRVLDQVVHLTRSPSDQPFRSRDAALLAREGYVVEESTSVSYYAPDADVLLSESFAGTHCFQLADAPLGEPGLIGLAFRPVAAALRRRDIVGTFWIDRASAELRAIDFAFTGLPAAAERADPGGRVEFTPLPDGVWLVSRWQIRMPDLERVTPSTVAGRGMRVVGSSIRLRGAMVVGGEITQVERGGAIVFRARGSALAVRLMPQGGEAASASAGSLVRLDGTDYVARADSDGVALFPLVLPGRYRIAVALPAGDADVARPLKAEADVGGDSLRTVQVRLPTRGPRVDAAGLGLLGPPRLRVEVEFTVTDTLARVLSGAEIIATDAARTVHRLRSDSLGKALLTELPLGAMRVEARMPGYHLAIGVVDVAPGRTPAQVLLERIQGTLLDAVRIEAAGDETARYGAFESRRRAGAATASITREEIEKRGVVNAWQMLRNVSAIELIEGPEGVVPVSRRVQSMDLRGGRPCYMRLAIDGVLLPESPVNLAQRMPSVPEIHGIEVFGGPATIPSEYAGDQQNMVCGLIVVWTR